MGYEQVYQKIIEEIKMGSSGGLLKLIESYKQSSSEQREFIRKSIDSRIAGQLLSYSYTAAIESVRESSAEKLYNGFVAQSIENSKRDYRDNVGILFLLYNSAKRLGENFNSIIERATELSSPDFASLLTEFAKRNDLDADLIKLSGYKIVEHPEFNYVWEGQ